MLLSNARRPRPIPAPFFRRKNLPCPILAPSFWREGGRPQTPIVVLTLCPDPHRLQRFGQRFRLQHHTLAAAERPVVHGAMPVVGKRPQIVHADPHQSLRLGAAQNAVRKEPREEFRKNSDKIELHGRSHDSRRSPTRSRGGVV